MGFSPNEPVPDLVARAAIRAKIRGDLAREAAEAEVRRAEIVPRVRATIAEQRSRGRCARAWLFGSYAGGPWGEPGEESDVDLLVEGDADGVGAAVLRETGRMVHGWRLDEAPPSLVARVLAEGVPL